MQVVGDRANDFEVTYLMGNGVDLHSFQPSVQDIAKISDADLFVYVGGESDEWAEDAVKSAANKNLRTVNMFKAVGSAAVEEERVEGMQADEHDHADASHSAEADHESTEARHDGEEGPEYDEHVWLSLRNAQVIVDAIANELAAVDSGNAAAYTANAKEYQAKLADLDSRYDDVVKAASKNTLVFADRFPFRYLVDDYGLKYYAAFAGCSAETEASFETVAFLSRKVDELGLGSVLVIESSDQKIAQTVVQNTSAKNQRILVMDSLQSTADADAANGKTYLSAMEDNLNVLKTALA
ncbi:MAG: zinc ABC transporter substrate-binding protein [Eggerthellaceae bacterium]|nr:zinc ABC transporter substrate-binding protein [Eggerthellaceae bacterium]